MIREKLSEEFGEDLLFLEEKYFDIAIMGVINRCNHVAVCYSFPMVVGLIQKNSEMSEEEALDYFYYNVAGAYVGDSTPVFLETL